jgi:hypothetical protein
LHKEGDARQRSIDESIFNSKNCIFCLRSVTNQQEFLEWKIRLEENRNSFEVSNYNYDLKYVKRNMQTIPNRTNITKPGSSAEAESSHKEEENKQRLISESGYFVDMHV